MDRIEKLRILAEAARYDASCASSGSKRERSATGIGNVEGMGICHSYTPDGRCVSLLKILLTNHCIYECRYCVNRASSPVRRARFTPEEVAELTVAFYQRNYIEGLFLSSGIVSSPDRTMEELARVAELLRTKHDFHGYIHLKVVPGASPALLERAGRHADRLSANVELPTQEDLDALAPAKTVVETEDTMGELRARIDAAREDTRSAAFVPAPTFAPAGQSTQLIVGATPSTDATILRTATRLYTRHKLRRVYYTAFSPIPTDTPGLPSQPTPLVRENRLYQADWLLRSYGFGVDELFSQGDTLPLDRDPKLAWALANRAFFPVDVNNAPREALLRVPGLGVRTVDRVLDARRHRSLSMGDLRVLRAATNRASAFVITVDHHPRDLDSASLEARVVSRQMPLFP